MKRLTLILGICAIAASLPIGLLADAEKDAGNSVKTFSGAPIDIACYIDGHSGIGDPSDCAESCIAKKGLPAGILTKEDGKNVVYIVLGKDSKKIFAMIAPYMNKMARITGEVIEVDNLKLIDLKKVEPLEAGQ